MSDIQQPQAGKQALVGTTLGDYELVEMVASGGMARIYKGLDRRLDRIAAVKVLMRELMENDDSLTERFAREARAIARLDHPNIIPIYQYGEQDDYYFLAMKFVQGRDLADELRDLRKAGQRMDVPRALELLGQVASALDYAHSFDIIHRDVKPSNVLLDGERAILTDFGLALWQSVDKTMGTAFGTPRYISPEQALASEKSVPQSDIYSLAVMVYEILTGDMLFRADSPMEIALSHISETPTPPRQLNPDIPEAAEAAILRALRKEPAERQRSATEFINALRAAYARPSAENAPAETARQDPGENTLVFSDTDKRRDAFDPTVTPTENLPDAARAALKAEAAKANTDAATARDTSRTPRSGPPLLLIGVLLLLIAGAGGVLLLSGGTTDPAPTATAASAAAVNTTPEAAPTTTPLPLLDGPALSLRYDDNTFVLKNISGETADLSALSFVAEDDKTYALSTLPNDLSGVADARCVVLVQSGRQFAPGAWGCIEGGAGRVAAQTTLASALLFWRSSAGDAFSVQHGGELIARCEAAPRGVETSCDFNLPVQ